MAYLKAQFTLALETLSQPAPIVNSVNERSFDFLRDVKKYATVNFSVIGEDHIAYACGGGFGLLLHGDETFTYEKRAPFIGLRRRKYAEHRLPFGPGDLLALYTDGMTEAQDTHGNDFGVERLNGIITRHREESAAAIIERCVAEYEAFRAADSDDITLLILKRAP